MDLLSKIQCLIIVACIILSVFTGNIPSIFGWICA